MTSKRLTTIIGTTIMLSGLGVMLWGRDLLLPLFVPLVPGVHQEGNGEIMTTNMSAPFKLWVLTSGSGLAIAVLGVAILTLSFLKKNQTPAPNGSR